MFNGYRVSVWGDGKVLEMDGGDRCTTMSMYSMPLNRVLKMVNFILCVFYHRNRTNTKRSYSPGPPEGFSGSEQYNAPCSRLDPLLAKCSWGPVTAPGTVPAIIRALVCILF